MNSTTIRLLVDLRVPMSVLVFVPHSLGRGRKLSNKCLIRTGRRGDLLQHHMVKDKWTATTKSVETEAV